MFKQAKIKLTESNHNSSKLSKQAQYVDDFIDSKRHFRFLRRENLHREQTKIAIFR